MANYEGVAVLRTCFSPLFYFTGKTRRKLTDTSSTTSRLSTAKITNIVEQLRLQQHRDSTRKNYYLVWRLFNNFIIKLDVRPSSWEDWLTLFVGHLIHEKKQSSTVKSYVSAIEAVLKTHDINIDEDTYLLASLIRACKLKNDSVRTRFPIQKGMLHVLLHKVEEYYSKQLYLSLLYCTLFCTTYYGMFRISEVTGCHTILAKDVQIATNKKKILFVLRSLKTHQEGSMPQIIKISSTDQRNSAKHTNTYPQPGHAVCPYDLLRKFTTMRGNFRSDNEPFFVFSDKSAVTPRQMTKCLKLMLKGSGFNEKLYSVYSLCAGRTCDLFKLGLSIETIKKLGQWKSNAIYAYLKAYC